MSDIPSTPADGNVRVQIVTAIADTNAPKVATEISAASSVDISCYLTANGIKSGLSEDAIKDERQCSRQVYEQKGRNTRSLELTYIDNTGSSNEALYNKAKDTLIPGSPMFLVVRRGMAYESAWAAGQKVSVWPITPGEYDPQPPEANSVLKIVQKMFVTGPVKIAVATVA